jgi:hypothetical protein
MRHLLVLVVLAGLTLSACDSVGPEADLVDRADLTRDAALLVGTWDLERVTFHDWLSGRRVSGPPQEPVRLVFGADSTFERYSGGSLVREGTFTVAEACNQHTGVCRNELILNGIVDPSWIGANEEWLVFDAQPVDGAEEVYRRWPE